MTPLPHDIVEAVRQYRQAYGYPTKITYLRGLVKTRPYVRTVMPPKQPTP